MRERTNPKLGGRLCLKFLFGELGIAIDLMTWEQTIFDGGKRE
jgi:hypothetical protein